MKFTYGNWLMRDGVEAFGAVDVRDVRVEDRKVTLFVAPFKVYGRGQTLTGPLLTLEFTTPADDVIGVNAIHYKGGASKSPRLFDGADKPVDATVADDKITIRSGKLTAEIDKDPFIIRYIYDGELLTVSDTKQLAYIKTDDGAFWRERLNISVGENLYGFGERFTSFVKNGQTVETWNEDGGTSSEIAYKSIPFYVSNRGYGVFVNDAGNVSFECGSEFVSKSQFSVKGESLQYYVIGGGDLRKVVSNYCGMTGKPALPPAWSFGLWLSTSFTTNYDDKTVNAFVDGMLEREIPLSVFHFDCFWMKEYEWCNFTWDDDVFPDPVATLKTLRDKGLKVCCWINPYVGQKSIMFDEGVKAGYFVKTADGGVWQTDLWQPGMAVVDFTNPAAAAWFTAKLRKLIEQGIDCFKTDFGERIPFENAVYYDGTDPMKMHNYYTFLYNKCVFDLLETEKGKGGAVLFARSATAGGQRFPAHWGGDCYATYESMAETLRGGLSLALCGFGFWSHDISGFENTATADLYKRWAAFGLLSTHSRLHGSSSYRVPWNFDDESVEVVKRFAILKNRLMPYLFAQAVKSHETGVPVLRPMVMEWRGDPVCGYLDKQYMFGGDILVAPVFNDRGETETYLPEGEWTHLLTNERETGGRFVKKTYDYFGLPIYARPNSIIVMGDSGDKTVYNYADDITVHLFDITERSAEIYSKNGVKVTTITAKRDGDKIVVSSGGLTNAQFVLHGDGELLIN